MKQTKRAERRSNNVRLLKKRFEQEVRSSCFGNRTVEENERDRKWAMWRARKRVDTNVLCSCAMCASPRKLHGNGENGLTFAERRSLDSFRDGVAEGVY